MPSPVKYAVLFVIALCCATMPASAQEQAPVMVAALTDEALLFQEIPSVVGASKYEQKITEAPSAVSIVTADDIRNHGYRTLADILRSVRSFYVSYDRNYSYAGVRGFSPPGDYNTRMLLTIDGHRMNDDPYDQALIGTEGILDVDLIDRVEIIRGPGSSLYGNNAFFAVVNVITKRGRDLKGSEVSAEAGNFDAVKGRATYGNKFGPGVEAILSASAYESKGGSLYYREFDPLYSAATNSRATNGGKTDTTDYDRYQSFFAKATLGDLTVEGAYISRTKGIPTGSFETDFNDPGNKTRDENAFLDLKYDRDLGSKTGLVLRLYYDHRRYEGDYMYNVVYGTGLNKDLGYGERWGSELRLTLLQLSKQKIIAGAEYQDVFRQDQKNYDVITPGTPYLDDQRRTRIWAAYLQDEISFSPKLLLNAGVRYDHYSTFGGTTNPRVALIYTPQERSAVKVLYGSAFRTPNAFELYYQSTTNLPNPNLVPETITTGEVVYERYFTDRLHAGISAYQYEMKHLISRTGTVPTSYVNAGDVLARGAEIEVDNRWRNGLEGRVSYGVQRAEYEDVDKPLANSPAHLVKLNIAVPVFDENLLLGLEEQYMSRRSNEPAKGGYAQAFSLTNVTLVSRSFSTKHSITASASIYNLFDRQYGDPVPGDFVQNTILQDGRNFRLKLVYSF